MEDSTVDESATVDGSAAVDETAVVDESASPRLGHTKLSFMSLMQEYDMPDGFGMYRKK